MPSDQGRRLTLQHKQAQTRIGTKAATALMSVWPLLDGTNLDRTLDRWLAAVGPIIAAHYQQSAALAAAYIAAYRTVETGDVLPVIEPPVIDAAAVATSVTVTGPVSVKSAIHRGIALPRAMDVARSASSAAGMRHALTGGRETIRLTLASDPEAAGYRRVASAGSCRYCTDLNGIRFDHDRVFEAHDGCSCTSEPVYR